MLIRQKKQEIKPVILAGGSGSRLWPLSRKSFPKQFSPLLEQKSLFQQAAQRLTTSEEISFSPAITLTNNDFRFIVEEQLKELDIPIGDIIIEPAPKNTAAAILAASIFAYQENTEAVLLVVPSDHLIPDLKLFHQTVRAGLGELEQGKIVTFGINPTFASTAYGYLNVKVRIDSDNYDILNFVEKPDEITASEMLNSGAYLWNAGIFLFNAKDMLEAFEKFMPTMLDLVTKSLLKASQDLNFLRLEAEHWDNLNDISIDYAIMEKIDNISAVPFKGKWSDLGDWNSIWDISIKDNDGVVTSQNASALECRNSLLRSESEHQHIVGVGLDNIIAVAMPDAVLVAHKDYSQEVRTAVNDLKIKHVKQAELFPKDFRPWGWFESLVLGERFQVKKIHVYPGESLSLQSHNHRSEHWVVVEGTAKVTVDKTESLITEGQSVYIPVGAVHRMENPGKIPMVLIEVQTGSYLGEDDILRFEDKYQRK